jgi:ribosomal protein S18 acetylase RimI-like enzyme
MTITVLQADYADPDHARAIEMLLDAYAQDPMGGGEALDPVAKARLVSELARRPHAFSVLAFVDGEPAGLVNCIEGFSTFMAMPLVNVHDIAVLPPFRGRGLSRRMLDCVERLARERGCCKLTLEVLSGNDVAQAAYRNFGFAPYSLDPAAGHAEFWQKKL